MTTHGQKSRLPLESKDAKKENRTMTIEMTQSNFEKITSRPGIVLVDCWAPWCRNCNDFADAYRRSAQRHADHLFATLNTQEQKELRTELGVQVFDNFFKVPEFIWNHI